MPKIERNELADLRLELEQLRRECRRSAAMTAEIIAAFGEAFRRERRADMEAIGKVRTEERLKVANRVVLPLGVHEHLLAVPSSGAARRVSALALCSDSSHVVFVRLNFEGSKPACVREVAGEVGSEASGTTFLVRLIAGESKTLFETAGPAVDIRFELTRVGGEPCLVELRVDEDTEGAVACDSRGKPRAGSRYRASTKGTLWKAQELLREGQGERAMRVALAYAADFERPALALLRATLAKDDEEWLENVNEYVEQFGIAPIRLKDGEGPRFLRLTSHAPPVATVGPLITVIMPAFNAEETLQLAAESILNQSWTALELIIVDDCSSDATWEISQLVAQLDPRVKLLRNKVNVGPYVSKNVALSVTEGAFITCHDADDWAHPQRLEKQVEEMQRSGSPASVASWLRLDKAGAFTGFTSLGRQSHDGALRLAHVTCMMEAEFMKRAVGYWDCVRFGADGEMLERVERILGRQLRPLRLLAALSLDAPYSLTNHPVHGISRTAGLSGTRRRYRDAWRAWHSTLTSDGAHVSFPQRGRPFEAPRECVVSTGALDLVRVGETSAQDPQDVEATNS